MTKKRINEKIDAMVKTVQRRHGLDETEARTMVGIALTKSEEHILGWIGLPRVDQPDFSEFEEPAKATS